MGEICLLPIIASTSYYITLQKLNNYTHPIDFVYEYYPPNLHPLLSEFTINLYESQSMDIITMFGATSLVKPAVIPSSTEASKLIEAIRDQTDGVPAHLVFVIDVVSVRFGGYFTPEIKAELQKFPYLQMLTLNDCGIVSLQNFPHLPGLIRLDLVFNQITGDTLNCIRGSRHLQTLMLGANKIQKFQHLEQLTNMKQLLQLDLINNPVSKLPGYREKMFSIFPTISILDTLDRSGKDAYTRTSMVQAISRVPDALFDKSPPPPPTYVPVIPPVPVRAAVPAARTASISKPADPVVRTTSRDSSRIKPDIKTLSKKGKSGKAGKSAVTSKSRSASSRAGLLFPVGRLKRQLKQTIPGIRVSKSTSVYLAAVLQYLSAQLLEGAGNIAKQDKKRRISPSQLKKALKMDEQFYKLLSGVTLSMGGQ